MAIEQVKIVTGYGRITGKPQYKVQGDPNGWHTSPKEAIDVHNRAKSWWENYHKNTAKGKK